MRACGVCQREAPPDRWLDDALCHGVKHVIRALTIFVDVGGVSRQTWAGQEQRALRVERSDLDRGRGPCGRANGRHEASWTQTVQRGREREATESVVHHVGFASTA